MQCLRNSLKNIWISYAHVKMKVLKRSTIWVLLLFGKLSILFLPWAGFSLSPGLGQCVLGNRTDKSLSSSTALSSWRKLWNAEVEPQLSRIHNLCLWFIYIGGRCDFVHGLLRTRKMCTASVIRFRLHIARAVEVWKELMIYLPSVSS